MKHILILMLCLSTLRIAAQTDSIKDKEKDTIKNKDLIIDSLPETPLYVGLTGFKGDCDYNSPIFTWYTEEEYNCDYFELQHSPDGMYFSFIRTIECVGAGTYILGINTAKEGYYRLLEVDKDGNRNYFNDKLVFMDCFTAMISTEYYDTNGKFVGKDFNVLPEGMYIEYLHEASQTKVSKKYKSR